MNYIAVFSAAMLPLACGNGIVEGSGLPGPAEVMDLCIGMPTHQTGRPCLPVYRPGKV